MTGEVSWDDLVGYVRKNVNRRAKEWEPALGADADKYAHGKLQDPHELSNLVATPVLARVEMAVLRKPDPLVVPVGRSVPGDRDRQRERSGFAESIGIKFIPLPAGEFLMGSPPLLDAYAAESEKPQHRVTIPAGRSLADREVTVGQFRRFVADTEYKTESESNLKPSVTYDLRSGLRFHVLENRLTTTTWQRPGYDQTDDHPVVNVSWSDAVAFCDWLTRKDGRMYRLPTEAEWEYACRAGTQSRYEFGEDPEQLSRFGNVADASYKKAKPRAKTITITSDDGFVYTAPVAHFEPNSWGLFDMYGNVMEWCADNYWSDYYQSSGTADPRGPSRAEFKVIRGGCFINEAKFCRSANRAWMEPKKRLNILGFRVIRVPPEH